MYSLLRKIGLMVVVALITCAGAFARGQGVEQSPKLPEMGVVRDRLTPEAQLTYHILVAELAAKRGNLKVALENYRAATQTSENPRLAEHALGIALFLEDYGAMLEIARRWHGLEPDSREARQALVLALLFNKRGDEVVDHLEAVRLAADDDGQGGFATLGALLGRVKDQDFLFQVARGLLNRHAQSPFANHLFALVAMDVREYEQALEAVNKTISLDSQWPPPYLLKARIKMAQGLSDEAVRELAEAVAWFPDDRVLRTGYARLLVSTERLAEARREFQELAERNPEDVNPIFALGLLAAEEGDYDQAVSRFMEVLQRGQRVMEIYFELGKVEEARGDYEEAKEWYGRVSSGDRFLTAQVRIGAVLAREKDLVGMAAHFDRLRQENPENIVFLYLSQANLLRDDKLYQAAYDLLTKALELKPEDEDLRYARAMAAERLDRLDVLERDLKILIEKDPDNGHALNALGYTLADRTERYQEALGYLKRAIALLPEDAAVLDSMGWIYYRLGDYGKSLEYLRDAYARNQDAEIASHLSEVLWVMGREDEAREIWQRALEQDPESEHLLELKERLDL
jgi:tetratricopeptide (TPR) repeat protein